MKILLIAALLLLSGCFSDEIPYEEVKAAKQSDKETLILTHVENIMSDPNKMVTGYDIRTGYKTYITEITMHDEGGGRVMTCTITWNID